MTVGTGNIIERLVRVKTAVGAVAKTERNTQGPGFNFRGIDRVVNAVSGALIEEGIVVYPETSTVLSSELVHYGSKNAVGFRTTVQATYVFSCDGGGKSPYSLPVQVIGEGIDSGDKSTAKAMSVAFRIALLQALTLPTSERDPDEDTYEVNDHQAEPEPENIRSRVITAISELGLSGAEAKIFIAQAVGHEYESFRSLTDDELETVMTTITMRQGGLS